MLTIHVRLQNLRGGEVFIDPDDVQHAWPDLEGQSTTLHLYSTDRVMIVRGSPREVYRKLFPQRLAMSWTSAWWVARWLVTIACPLRRIDEDPYTGWDLASGR